ncbi:hypothetical protein BB934_37245 (plasmid) [Microvirga ossetica]|uniref:Uncharacterized protein n=1 Tax=Microvirga ossetica TaxID=1882682 RepID=A0A1B2EV63_9HYPH|nr:hypothetical protein BB934_37245 [Microvirga ossetica]
MIRRQLGMVMRDDLNLLRLALIASMTSSPASRPRSQIRQAAASWHAHPAASVGTRGQATRLFRHRAGHRRRAALTDEEQTP